MGSFIGKWMEEPYWLKVFDNKQYKMEYTQVKLIENKLSFTTKYIFLTSAIYHAFVYGNRILRADGALYDNKGQVTKANGWRYEANVWNTNKRYFPQLKNDRLRVFDVQTQASWDVKLDLSNGETVPVRRCFL